MRHTPPSHEPRDGNCFQLEALEQRMMLAGGPGAKTTTQIDNSGTLGEWLYTLPSGGIVRFLVISANGTTAERGTAPVRTHSLAIYLDEFGLAEEADEFSAVGHTDQFQEIDGPGFKSVRLQAVVAMHDGNNGVDFPLALDLTWKLQGPWTSVHDKEHDASGDFRYQGKYTNTGQVTGTAVAPEGDGSLIAPGMNLVHGSAVQGTIFQSTLVITSSPGKSDLNSVLGSAAPVLP